MDNYYTINLPKVQLGSAELILQTLEYLIGYIYSHMDRPPFDDPEVRVGIVERLLIRLLETHELTGNVTAGLNPVIRDLEILIANDHTYEGYDKPAFKRECLLNELRLLKNITEPIKNGPCILL